MLRSFLAEHIRLLLNPALAVVSITEVRMSQDLRHARVFWSFFDSLTETQEAAGESETPDAKAKKPISKEERIREVEKGLKDVENRLKQAIANELTLRFVPELRFEYDRSLETGKRIDELLKKAGY